MVALKCLKSHLILAINNDHIRLSLVLRGDLRAVGEQVSTVQSSINTLAMSVLSPDQEAITRSLLMLDMSSMVRGANIDELKKGALGFLKEQKVRAWQDTVTSPFELVLTRGPGTGKAVIAKVLDYYLAAWFASGSRICSVSIFFNFTKQQIQDEEAVFSSIVQQMVLQHPHLWRHCGNNFVTGGVLPISESVAIVSRARLDLSRLYLILDAIDETPVSTIESVIQRLRNIEPPIHLFATCRPFSNVCAVLAEASQISVNDFRRKKDDVTEFIRYMIENSAEFPKIGNLPSQVAEDIARIIAAKSNGMFIYARLLLERLLSASSVTEIYDLLENSLRSLDDAYHSLLQKIENQSPGNAEQGKMLLDLVLKADIPVTAQELIKQLETQLVLSPGETLDIRCKKILSECTGNLLVINDRGFVAFVHWSARDFYSRHIEMGKLSALKSSAETTTNKDT
ncbi:Hypothetical protein R9X50_00346000 [Acrodontium crateriforme]|uniref:Nephrocystin 3-like N-terminal domain-containing protein n=1 Tax=Acrodontium crateriforme TaxID=150365 RepID=A0AAQ3R9X0_9PEZI|nr:Hypothetical protein R9X50_00346000 [Acrodontium crateriforme]